MISATFCHSMGKHKYTYISNRDQWISIVHIHLLQWKLHHIHPKISCDFAMGGRQQHFPKRRWDAPASNPEKGRSGACACALNLGETWWNQFCFNQWWNPNRVQVLGPVNLWSSCQALLVNALEIKKWKNIYLYHTVYFNSEVVLVPTFVKRKWPFQIPKILGHPGLRSSWWVNLQH